MRKLLALLTVLFIPFAVSAADVKTIEVDNINEIVIYEGTTDKDTYAVMCKLYNSENKEIDMESQAVEDNKFSGSFLVADEGTYKVACANYDGGKFLSGEVEVKSKETEEKEEAAKTEIESINIEFDVFEAGTEVVSNREGEEVIQTPELKGTTKDEDYIVEKVYVVKGFCKKTSGDCIDTFDGKLIGGKKYYVTIVVTPKDGYRIGENTLKNVKINGVSLDDKNSEYVEGFEGGTVLIVYGMEAKILPILPNDSTDANDIAAANALEDVLVNGSSDENSDELINNIEEARANGDVIKISLVADVIEEDNLDSEEKALIDNELKNNSKLKDANIMAFADLKLVVNINGVDQTETIHKLNSPMTVRLYAKDAIKDLPSPEEGKMIEFKILRIHNGEVSIIDAYYDTETGFLTFETDSFSTYAITYNYVAVPKTGDNIISGLALLAISIFGLIGCSLYINKQMN